MNQYISSFLVEPVIRQARRQFSRTSFSPEPLPGPQRPRRSATNDFPEYVDTLDTSSDGGDRDDHQNLHVMQHRPPVELHDDRVSLPGSRSQHATSNGSDNVEMSEPGPREAQDANRTRAETDPQIVASSSTRRASVLASQFRFTNASFPSSINEAGMRYMGGSGRSRQGTGQSSIMEVSPVSPSPIGGSTLPEDDGMGRMRERIIKIQDMKVSGSEKSRLIHALMTEQYSSSQLNLNHPHDLRPHSPSSFRSHDRPFTPTSTQSTNDLAPTASPQTSLSSGADVELCVTLQDQKPTYYVPRTEQSPDDASTDDPLDSTDHALDGEDDERPLGCMHYKRNVKLQCSACAKWYTCRFCHDEVEDHSLNRRETKNMLCMLCGCAQRAAENCRECGEPAAWYYCGICKLWDNDPEKSIYHCNDCGICRIGQGLGKDFYHCKASFRDLNDRPCAD